MSETARTHLLRKRAIWMLAIAAWPVFWLAVPYWIVPGDENGYGHQLVTDTYRGLLWLWHVPQAKQIVFPWLVVASVIACASLATAILIRAFVQRIDPDDFSLTGLRWSLHAIPCAMAWWLGVVIYGYFALSSKMPDWLTMAVGSLALFLTLFVSLRPDVIALARPPIFWMPRWPGWAIVMVTLSVGIATTIVNVAEGIVMSVLRLPVAVATPVFTVGMLVCWLLNLLLTLTMFSAWQYQQGPIQLFKTSDQWLTRKRLRVLAALDLRIFGIVMLVLGPPLLVFSVYLIYLAPSVEAWMRYHKLPLSAGYHALMYGFHGIVKYGWMLSAWTGLVVMAAMARTLVVTDAVEVNR